MKMGPKVLNILTRMERKMDYGLNGIAMERKVLKEP